MQDNIIIWLSLYVNLILYATVPRLYAVIIICMAYRYKLAALQVFFFRPQVCLVIAVAAAQHQQRSNIPPGLIYWVPVLRQPAHEYPLASAKAAAVSAPAPDVITQGLHLGHQDDESHSSEFSNDAPASMITQGPYPGAYTAVSSDEPSEATQFHSQDGQGQFLFGHSSPQQARLESRSADGTVRGSYSYINPDGRTIKVTYTAGENGFQPVEEGEGVFPQPVTETPEVAAARALHARLYDQAKWLAELSPEEDEESKPVEAPPSSVAGAGADRYHPPDSIYTNMGTVGVESEEGLEYYGAAKGTPLAYAGKNLPAGNKVPHAYSGAYVFPNLHQYINLAPRVAPILSAYSAPSLHEQQHLHRVAPNNDQIEERQSQKISAYSAPVSGEQQHLHRASLGADETKPQPYYAAQSRAGQNTLRGAYGYDNIEYYGAAKLLAYSAANLVYNNEQQHLHRGAKSLSLPSNSNPGTYSSYGHTGPVFVAVEPQTVPGDMAISRTAGQAVPPASVSQKAQFFGAAPVAAVHDAQVAPGQNVKDHQKLPVYIEAN